MSILLEGIFLLEDFLDENFWSVVTNCTYMTATSWIVDVLSVEAGIVAPTARESFYVSGDCVIGRDKTHEASFEEKGVSRSHGKLTLDAKSNELFYTDTKSTFGTFELDECEFGGVLDVEGGKVRDVYCICLLCPLPAPLSVTLANPNTYTYTYTYIYTYTYTHRYSGKTLQ